VTYIPRDQVTQVIPNKFEAVRVLSLECRRLNDEMRAREQHTERKITSMAVQRLFDGEVEYYDARERREQERSEAMLAAAEGILDAPPTVPEAELSEGEAGESTATEEEESTEAAASDAAAEVDAEAPVETGAEAEPIGSADSESDEKVEKAEADESAKKAPTADAADEVTEAEAAKE